MANCNGCGREIEKGKAVNLGTGGVTYHLACAPEQLVHDALTEWNAIVAKGVKYFITKYVPSDVRPSRYSELDSGEDSSASYSNLFTEVGGALRVESNRRKTTG